MLKLDKSKVLLAIAYKCITTEELQKESEVGRTTISKILNGKKTEVQAHIAGKIARALGVKVEDLLED